MRLPTLCLLLSACAAVGDDPTALDKDALDTAPASDTDVRETDVGEPTVPSQREINLRTGAGDQAADLLTDAVYDRITVEVDHLEGAKPTASTLTRLKRTIEALCNKPGGVTVAIDDVIPADQGRDTWTLQEGQELEVAWRDGYRNADTGEAVLYVLFLDGASAGDTSDKSTLGYAYHATSLVMFPGSIDRLGTAGPLGLATDPEGIVMQHELGHVIGLVNNGIEMVTPHQDADHGAHDDNADCIMHWTADNAQLADRLLGGTPTFDGNCLADVEAAGGRAVGAARRALP